MGKNQKKKGKGAEKTIAKTEKKLAQKMKKKLAIAGEDNIEQIVTRIEVEEQKRSKMVERILTVPTRRAFCSLTAHPYKDELLMFGGEFHNGHETEVYNDLFFYKIPSDEWTLVRAPGAPPPRTSHQAVAVGLNKGELWIFGGEFTTKSESQFHHYKDLWQLHLDTMKWTKIEAPGGPSPRSGHRMVSYKRQLLVFGGYHDVIQDYRYYNDLYSFSLDDRKWTKLTPSGTAPQPRSGCQMAVTPEGKVLIWGGYSKTRVKKDVDQGVVHTDMFLLSPEKGDETGLKWKWSVVKAGGARCGPLTGVSSVFSGRRAYTFGGASDTETEEEVTAVFFNQLHSLDLSKFIWSQVTLSMKKEQTKPRRRRKGKEGTDEGEGMDLDQDEEDPIASSNEKVVDDGVFRMRVGPTHGAATGTSQTGSQSSSNTDLPHPRTNCTLALKGSKLYLYGGLFEEDDKQHTLGDFHVLDIHKLDEWKTLIACDLKSLEWVESPDNSDSESGSEEETDSSEEEESSDDKMEEDQ